jgi:hypothetical protein
MDSKQQSNAVPGSATSAVAEVEPTIVDKVEDFVRRFVFFKDDSLYRLVALWIIATHLHQEFEFMGYLFAHSAGPQSGKSRLLEVLDLLVYNSSGIDVSISEAVLFRTAYGGTQLMDEIDSQTNREVLRSVLNAGFRKGNRVRRTCRNLEGASYDIEEFPVYAPRALAGIGRGILDRTTLDRTFVLEMVPRKREERGEKFRLRIIRPEAEALKGKITDWVEKHKKEVIERYERDEEFQNLEPFRERTIDVAQPLAAILEVACKDSPDIGQERSDFVEAVSITRKDEEHLAEDLRVLRELKRQAAIESPLVGTASELAGLSGTVDEVQVSGVLRRHGFETKSIRKGGAPKYRYSLEHGKLEDLLARLAGVKTEPEQQAPGCQVEKEAIQA